jgi:predicted DNA-binding protein (UPF0251 family)
MKHLAKAVIQALAFLELSDEENVNQGAAERALDVIRNTLSSCTEDERETLESVLKQERRALKTAGAAADLLDFYDNFMENFGLDDE